MDETLFENVMRLVLDYAEHKSNCEVVAIQKHFDDIAKTAKDCGQRNFSIGATGIKCTCGYNELVKRIKEGIKQTLEGE